jgi:hypothetical protein
LIGAPRLDRIMRTIAAPTARLTIELREAD